MNLTPREKDKLLVAMAAVVARRRLERGVKLNYPESVALLTTWAIERARDGRSVEELMVTGRQVKAEEALRIGLADEVVAPEALHERALALAAEVAAGALQAHALMKQAVDVGTESDLASGLALELTVFEAAFDTVDAGIGVESFRANGPGKATFTGK